MNAIDEPKPWRSFLSLLCFCLPLLTCFGCASYFRTGEISCEDLKEKLQAQQAEDHMMFKPGAVFYTR